MSTTTPSPHRLFARPRPLGALLIAVLVTAAASCGGTEGTADARSAPGGESSSTTTEPDPATTPGDGEVERPDGTAGPTTEPASPVESEACRPGEGKTVTELPDVEIPAHHIDAIRTDDQEIAGDTVPGLDIPAVDIPAMTVDGGCTIEYDAPAGCVPKVEITGIEVPALEVPGVEVPAIDTGGLDVAADSVESETVSAESVSGEVVEQECQAREREGFVPGVYRPGIFRPGVFRPGVFRSGIYRAEACVDDQCVAELDIPAVDIPAVDIPAAEVDAAELKAKELPDLPDVPVYGDDDETAYLAPADVLFDFDSANLKAEATPILTAIAGEAVEAGGSAEILVDGHTDSMGDDAYNDDLSERRARTVADWLVANGGLADGQITVTGYGESVPVAPNETPDGADDPDGRERNRRVVISVRTN